jgi:hypothetical protein
MNHMANITHIKPLTITGPRSAGQIGTNTKTRTLSSEDDNFDLGISVASCKRRVKLVCHPEWKSKKEEELS